MGRKKKADIEAEQAKKAREAALGGDAKRSILAIFLFAFSILFFLAFIGQAGKFGESVGDGLGVALGFGKWLLVPLLVLVGLMLLRRHETTLSDRIKYTGLTLSFLAVLGLTHMFVGEGKQELLAAAEDGLGGGYVGYWLTSFFVGAMGKVAAGVILLALFITGAIAAFNVSLLNWFESLQERWRKPLPETTPETPLEGTEETKLSLDPALSLVGNVKTDEEKHTDGPSTTLVPVVSAENVKNIRFVGDDIAPDQNEGDEALVKNVAFDDPAREPLRPVQRKRSKIRWELPPLDLLEATTGESAGVDIEQNKQIIINTLQYFGIAVEPGEALVGPTVTQYTFKPAVGVKLSRITALNNNLALALAAQHIRIEAPIPGKALIGIEVPNRLKTTVRLKDILESRDFRGRSSNLTLVLGQDVSGKAILADLGKMPHLLIAGTTRSGKSVCINTIILSLLYQNSPEDLKLILVDPKRVELSLYKSIPHLRTDVIVDNHKVVNVLKWAVSEMERRNRVLQESGSRDLFSYRDKVDRGERRRFVDPDTNELREEELEPLPLIVFIIDEMADLMVQHGKEVQSLIIRLAQMGRAVGVHLILATQRPEVNVVTGLIKANMPARISFKLKSQIDSRTILDTGGAEKLLGNGDMLYSSAEASSLKRIQGVYVSEQEVKAVVDFLLQQKEEKGYDEIGEDLGGSGGGSAPLNLDAPAGGEGSGDEMYERAKQITIETQNPSTTHLQMMLEIGYPRAARLTQLLLKNGIIGNNEAGKRAVLVQSLEEGKQYGDDPLADQAAREKWQM